MLNKKLKNNIKINIGIYPNSKNGFFDSCINRWDIPDSGLYLGGEGAVKNKLKHVHATTVLNLIDLWIMFEYSILQ